MLVLLAVLAYASYVAGQTPDITSLGDSYMLNNERVATFPGRNLFEGEDIPWGQFPGGLPRARPGDPNGDVGGGLFLEAVNDLTGGANGASKCFVAYSPNATQSTFTALNVRYT